MRIRDVMTKNPVTVGSETLVIEARRLEGFRSWMTASWLGL
jgi:hypothetical protein